MIPLQDIPTSGIDRWIPLEGRTARSNVQGQIRLRLSLGTREERGTVQGEDNWKEVVEHQQLLWIFVQYTLEDFKMRARPRGSKVRVWDDSMILGLLNSQLAQGLSFFRP